jgi:glycosyltransferase involved in cell wall biosynthesis
MIILTTTYNCEKYVETCLTSIKNQTLTDFTCYITDDLSTDGTVDKIKKIIEGDDRFILIENEKKMYQVGNYDQVIRGLNIDDNEICIEVDGDDWLPNSGVFKKILDVYSDENVWMTSGSFKYSNGRSGFAKPPHSFTNVRNQTFTLSHLRTWKSWLWKKILPEDLRDELGNYWDISGDLAFMFPMFEMCGEKSFRFLNDILYVYNDRNPLNEHKVDMGKVSNTTKKIRSKLPYTEIK